jgi:oligosaccharide repeat unit polymerase
MEIAMYETALAFSVLCLGLVGFYFLRSPYFNLFHPLTIYIAFHGFIFVIRPILALIYDYQYIYRGYDFNPSASDKLTVILASNLGFLVFSFFCLRTGSVAMKFKQDAFGIAERNRLTQAFIWVLVICVPIGIYSLATLWLEASQGVAQGDMAIDKGTGTITNTGGNGYLAEAQLMLATCSAMVAWLFRFRLVAIMPLLFFVIFRAGTGGRGPFVTAMVAVSLLYLYENQRKVFTLRVGLLLVGAVALFNTIGSDRGDSMRRWVVNDTSAAVYEQADLKMHPLEGMDFGNLEYFEYLVYAIPQRTHTYGYFIDLLQVFTEPVPRVLWANKPVGAPFNEIFLFKYGRPMGMTRSLPGQGWYSFGWLGVIIWCGIWGYALGALYRRFVQGPQNTLQTAAYMMFLPILLIGYRDGTLVTLARQSLFFLGPIVLWYFVARYLGIPSAQEMRSAFTRKLRRLQQAGEPSELAQIAEQTAAVPTVRSQRLPNAVIRRRRALAPPSQGVA